MMKLAINVSQKINAKTLIMFELALVLISHSKI